MPSFPWDIGFALARDVPRGHRSLVGDCADMVSRVDPAPVIIGAERIPESGPIVIAANHYQRRGLWIGWPGAVITVSVAQRRPNARPVNWLVTGGVRLWQARRRGPEIPFTAYFIRRMAHTYGMTALPLSGASSRAAVLREWLRCLDTGDAIGLFPEGLAGSSAGLCRPEAGFTQLSRIFQRRGARILPVALFEEDRVLQVRFGCPFFAASQDDTMEAIASLLPPSQRGPFGNVRVPLE